MTLVCAPTRNKISCKSVDLYELTEGSSKFLYDLNHKLQWIDIDWQEIAPSFNHVIVSYHNFDQTPDLELVLLQMKAKHPGARYYKLATWASSTVDALRMLHFQRQHPEVIGLCMGEKGELTRILAPVVGCPIMYAPLSDEDRNAPGQLLWSKLKTIYHFRQLSPSTRIYGLIGDPVSHSIGHLFHNDQFREHQDAVYVKMCVTAQELPNFFQHIEDLPIAGLSVTAPLKEKLFPFLSTMSKEAQEIGAINTVIRTPKGWAGFNTDGKAAASSLMSFGNVKGKKVVILGAGGAARAVAYELIRQQAMVTLIHRNREKGQMVAQQLGCLFAQEISPYDILVNATASPDPVKEHVFTADTIVMDLSIATTPFLQKARISGCQTVDGLPMYFHQALAQRQIWMSA
jgi:3-dehydroquinate dehydratase / shikimate dehydrogenase